MAGALAPGQLESILGSLSSAQSTAAPWLGNTAATSGGWLPQAPPAGSSPWYSPMPYPPGASPQSSPDQASGEPAIPGSSGGGGGGESSGGTPSGGSSTDTGLGPTQGQDASAVAQGMFQGFTQPNAIHQGISDLTGMSPRAAQFITTLTGMIPGYGMVSAIPNALANIYSGFKNSQDNLQQNQMAFNPDNFASVAHDASLTPPGPVSDANMEKSLFLDLFAGPPGQSSYSVPGMNPFGESAGSVSSLSGQGASPSQSTFGFGPQSTFYSGPSNRSDENAPPGPAPTNDPPGPGPISDEPGGVTGPGPAAPDSSGVGAPGVGAAPDGPGGTGTGSDGGDEKRGGTIPNKHPGRGDDEPHMLQGGEAVINRPAVDRFHAMLSMMNQSTGGKPIHRLR